MYLVAKIQKKVGFVVNEPDFFNIGAVIAYLTTTFFTLPLSMTTMFRPRFSDC